jgi:hypothetical protein
LQADELALMLEANPALQEESRKHIQAKIDEYRALDKKLTSDPATQEGLDELFVKGKAVEAARDLALERDPYFVMTKPCCRSRSCSRPSRSSRAATPS